MFICVCKRQIGQCSNRVIFRVNANSPARASVRDRTILNRAFNTSFNQKWGGKTRVVGYCMIVKVNRNITRDLQIFRNGNILIECNKAPVFTMCQRGLKSITVGRIGTILIRISGATGGFQCVRNSHTICYHSSFTICKSICFSVNDGKGISSYCISSSCSQRGVVGVNSVMRQDDQITVIRRFTSYCDNICFALSVFASQQREFLLWDSNAGAFCHVHKGFITNRTNRVGQNHAFQLRAIIKSAPAYG